jgi:hypothetical protein
MARRFRPPYNATETKGLSGHKLAGGEVEDPVLSSGKTPIGESVSTSSVDWFSELPSTL